MRLDKEAEWVGSARGMVTKTNASVDRMGGERFRGVGDVDDPQGYWEAVERAAQRDEKTRRTDDLVGEIVDERDGPSDEKRVVRASRSDATAVECGETPTSLEYIVCSMSTSIRVSEETKRKLEAIKREGETFDDLLARLSVTRTEEDVREMAGFGGEGIADGMAESRDELNESLEQRTNR